MSYVNNGRLMGSPSISSQHVHLNMRGNLMSHVCDCKAWTRGCVLEIVFRNQLLRPRDAALTFRRRRRHPRAFCLILALRLTFSLKSPLASPQARLPTSNGPPTLAGQRHRSAPPRLPSIYITHVTRDTLHGESGSHVRRAHPLLYIGELDPYSYVP